MLHGKIDERANIKTKDEIGELSQSFNVMAEEIENKINELNIQVKQKDDFINGFSHELKTPMTAIIGYADLLRLKKCDEETTKKALNYIYSEAKRLETLSFKMLELMSLTNQKIEMKYLNIENLIEKVTNSENLILSKNKVICDVEEATVYGDFELLEVVIKNLIENADKAEPKDNIILVKGQKLINNKYKISVIDKGKGIPKEHILRVTEDLYMVDKSRNSNGTGIGLSLVKKILKLHESDIYIESIEGMVTTVYFELKGEK